MTHSGDWVAPALPNLPAFDQLFEIIDRRQSHEQRESGRGCVWRETHHTGRPDPILTKDITPVRRSAIPKHARMQVAPFGTWPVVRKFKECPGTTLAVS